MIITPLRSVLKVTIIALCLFVIGCSSTPVKVANAVESSKIFDSLYLKPSEIRTEKAVIILDDLFGPSIFEVTIHVGGKKIAALKTGEKVTIYLKPGINLLGWSALTDGNYRQQEFTISKDLKNVFHLTSPGGDVMGFIREI